MGADERFVGRIFRDMAPFNNNKSKAGKANVSKRWDKTSEVKDLVKEFKKYGWTVNEHDEAA